MAKVTEYDFGSRGAGRFQNIRVYCTSHAHSSSSRSLTSTPGLAFVVYWGIVLFGYDTYVVLSVSSAIFSRLTPSNSGIGGGVVAQDYFQQHFGFYKNAAKANDISSNVVSVLQAGAFFGALGSAPISSYLGRRWTLFGFSLLFAIGAVRAFISATAADH